MHAITSLSQVTGGFTGTAVTIGKFDGIHLGHQRLISALTAAAAEHSIQSVVVTFDRHPDALLKPSHAKLPIIGPKQKHDLIAKHDVDVLVTLPFDQELANLGPEDFVQAILVDGLKAKIVLVGEDFRFGNRGAGDVHLLHDLGQQLGFEVRVIASALLDGEKISSSAIREALEKIAAFPGVTGVFNFSPADHNGLDESAFASGPVRTASCSGEIASPIDGGSAFSCLVVSAANCSGVIASTCASLILASAVGASAAIFAGSSSASASGRSLDN